MYSGFLVIESNTPDLVWNEPQFHADYYSDPLYSQLTGNKKPLFVDDALDKLVIYNANTDSYSNHLQVNFFPEALLNQLAGYVSSGSVSFSFRPNDVSQKVKYYELNSSGINECNLSFSSPNGITQNINNNHGQNNPVAIASVPGLAPISGGGFNINQGASVPNSVYKPPSDISNVLKHRRRPPHLKQMSTEIAHIYWPENTQSNVLEDFVTKHNHGTLDTFNEKKYFSALLLLGIKY